MWGMYCIAPVRDDITLNWSPSIAVVSETPRARALSRLPSRLCIVFCGDDSWPAPDGPARARICEMARFGNVCAPRSPRLGDSECYKHNLGPHMSAALNQVVQGCTGACTTRRRLPVNVKVARLNLINQRDLQDTRYCDLCTTTNGSYRTWARHGALSGHRVGPQSGQWPGYIRPRG
jgi:hypothetical protein